MKGDPEAALRLAVIFALVLLLAPVHAEGAVRGVVHQRFIALLNPMALLAPPRQRADDGALDASQAQRALGSPAQSGAAR